MGWRFAIANKNPWVWRLSRHVSLGFLNTGDVAMCGYSETCHVTTTLLASNHRNEHHVLFVDCLYESILNFGWFELVQPAMLLLYVCFFQQKHGMKTSLSEVKTPKTPRCEEWSPRLKNKSTVCCVGSTLDKLINNISTIYLQYINNWFVDLSYMEVVYQQFINKKSSCVFW